MSLNLLRRVTAVGKMKKILNIEAALEMIALGMVICSEVHIFTNIDSNHSDKYFINKNSGVFPEFAREVKAVIERFDFCSFFLADYIKCY